MVNDDRQLVERTRRELDAQVEGMSPSLQGRLRAARREAVAMRTAHAPRRYWLPALAASLAVVVVTTLWLEHARSPDLLLESMLQTASMDDLPLLREGDDLELYRELEFYYWLEQEQAHAG